MTPKQFVTTYGVEGCLRTLNGPRLYIERVRSRVVVSTSKDIQQFAWIDLCTYAPHCATYSSKNPSSWCKARSAEVELHIAPLARLARIRKVEANAPRPILTQSRLIQLLLRRAGIECGSDGKAVTVDLSRIARALNVPVHAIGANYEARIVSPAKGLFIPLPAKQEDPLAGAKLVIGAYTSDPNHDLMARLRQGAEALVEEATSSTFHK